MVSKGNIKVGSVCIARINFVESARAKYRPVVVLSQGYGEHKILAIGPISSSSKTEAVDVDIKNLVRAGLIRPSTIRIHRISTMLSSELVKQIGELSADDLKVVKGQLRKYLITN